MRVLSVQQSAVHTIYRFHLHVLYFRVASRVIENREATRTLAHHRGEEEAEAEGNSTEEHNLFVVWFLIVMEEALAV